jgi:hypothetical protein
VWLEVEAKVWAEPAWNRCFKVRVWSNTFSPSF